jgi:lysophospholipase L1-like esterase
MRTTLVSVTLSLAATAAGAASLPVAHVFIASDSTAQDYGPEYYPQEGWGSMLRCAFGSDVIVENRAIAARSTRTFIDEGRLAEIAHDIRAGDTLLIQFGHNDANQQKPERYANIADYKTFLGRFIDTALHAGAQPVLLTPVTRRNFVGNAVVPSFPEYSAAVREVARITGVPLIDLDTLSGRWVELAGTEASKRYFLDDDTHFTELGARGIAEIIAARLAGLGLPASTRVMASRPALVLTTPTGGVSCETPISMAKRTFRFIGPAGPGEVPVGPATSYRGSYGFEPGSTRLFSVAVSEGNYRVTVTLGDRSAATTTTIKAESRRLMLPEVRTSAGEIATRSFVVNVRNSHLAPPPVNAPGSSGVRLNARESGSYTWDDRLTLELLGDAPRVATVAIEPVRVPTVYLLGDSTVTDQRDAPYAGWGQMLPAFFGPDAAIANHAESGETLKSFLAESRLDKVLASIKPGDFALIQFGHNDQKFQWPQTYAAAATTYRTYLRAYIAEIRLRGATPLLVAPPERRNFTQAGAIRPTLSEYANAVRAVAAAEKVTLIDLHAASIRFYEALGPTRAPLAFAAGGSDATHHDDYGAYVLAQAIAQEIRNSGSPLANLLASDLAPFDPSHPIAPEAFRLAASPARAPVNRLVNGKGHQQWN